MVANLSTVNAISKEIYGPRIVDQMEQDTVLTKRMEKTSRGTTSEVGGKYVTFPLKVRRNAGIGYRDEYETLQRPGQQGWVNVRVPLKYGYGRILLTGQIFDLVSTNYQAFADAMTEEMSGLKDDIQKDTNRILWGNGLGVVATVDSGSSSTTVTAGSEYEDVKHVEMGMKIDILSSDGTSTRGTDLEVVDIDEGSGAFEIDSATTVSAGDIIVRTGNFDKEPQGMTSLVSDSDDTLFNLDPTTEPKWRSTVDDSGGALSESKMIKMCDVLKQKGGKPSAIFTDLGTRRAYFNLLTTQRRFTGTQEFDGGFKGLAFAYDTDIPVIVDVDAPAGKMWFIKEDTFKIYRSSPWAWEDRDGSVWKWVNDKDAWEALMKQYWEFAIERRNVNGVMTDITAG